MTALEVERDDEPHRVVAVIGPRRARNARHRGGAVAVAAVEDPLLVDPDGLANAVGFDVGQGTQDVGFRNDVDILFNCLPAIAVKLRVLDESGKPTTASYR